MYVASEYSYSLEHRLPPYSDQKVFKYYKPIIRYLISARYLETYIWCLKG